MYIYMYIYIYIYISLLTAKRPPGNRCPKHGDLTRLRTSCAGLSSFDIGGQATSVDFAGAERRGWGMGCAWLYFGWEL